MAIKSVTMKFYKSTKNTHVYKAAGEGPNVIESVYVEKREVPGPVPPQVINIAVTFEG